MTSSSEINTFLKNDPVFMGCFPSDKLPPMKGANNPQSMIVNTQRASKPGEHWIALVMTKRHCFYFDSFGLPVIEFHITEYLSNYYSKVIYSSVCIQDIDSNKCGEFCIGFVKHTRCKKTYNTYLSNFNFKHVELNDLIVTRLINTM